MQNFMNAKKCYSCLNFKVVGMYRSQSKKMHLLEKKFIKLKMTLTNAFLIQITNYKMSFINKTVPKRCKLYSKIRIEKCTFEFIINK